MEVVTWSKRGVNKGHAWGPYSLGPKPKPMPRHPYHDGYKKKDPNVENSEKTTGYNGYKDGWWKWNKTSTESYEETMTNTSWSKGWDGRRDDSWES